MKTKTLLILLLALPMPVVSIGFTPFFAPKEAKVTFADGGHIHEGNTFTAWSESDSLPDATGYYYLTSDVEISSTWTPASNTYLCLNGHGIRLTGEGCVIQIAEGKSFNLFDCPFSGVQTHKYAIDETGLATVDDALAENYEIFTGGYITGGNGSNGSGISLATGLSNSTTRLTMDGGTIIGNHTTTDGGGISYYWTSGMKGAISLSNATILGNVADKQGGGIFHQASNDKMELKGKNVITRNVSGSAPAGVLEESLIYIQGDLHIEGNHLTNGDPSDLSVSHPWGQPDRLIVSGELAPTSRIGIDTIRRGQIEDYDTYNDLDPNTILSSNSGDIYGIQDGKVVSNIMDEDLEITYDGEGHVPTVTLPDPSITYTIAYGLEEGTYDLDTPPTFTSAGDHRFYYEIVAGLNTRRGHIDVHIVKENPVVTLAPTAVEDLAYTGEAQTLLVAGTATGGTMQYRIGEGEWSETLPSATSAGTHDVYYRVKGDDLHADLDPVLIQVTISANDKTALSSAINDAQDYLDSVQTAYGPLTGALEEEIENAAAVRDDANKTTAEISDAVTNLNNVKGALVSAIAEVEDVKTKINGLDDVITLSSEDGIVAARTAYDALNGDQKALINVETRKKLTDAEAALADIKADHAAADKVAGLINAIGEVTLEKEDEISAARTAYDALNDDQKALIGAATIKKLTDAESAFDGLKADQVVARIEAIGDVDLDKEDEIVAARNGYDALSAAQKALVGAATLQKLVDAEATLATMKADKSKADGVASMINGIGEVTLDKESAIVAAREAYDALSDDQKAFVDEATLQKLVDAEAALVLVKADKAAADNVAGLINAIGEVTLGKEGTIASAREAYEALNERAKSFLDEATLQTLIDAEATLAALKADKAAIDHAKELINSIGEVTLEKESLIEEARAAYDALTDAQKERIPEYLVNILNSAEKTLASLKADKAATDAFKALVEDIGEIDGSEACRKRIEAAKSAYDSLSEKQKAAVASEYQALLHMEASHNKMVSDKRLFTILTIAGIALGGVVALLLLLYAIGFLLLRKFVIEPLSEKVMRVVVMKKKAGIATLLTPRLKKIYYPEDELYRDKEKALAAVAMSKAKREDVLNAIHAIGEISLEKEEEICLARKSLDALPDQQKAKIDASDIRVLETAEETLTSLKAKASAKRVETLIRQISKETEANPATIEKARKAYDALSENEKSYLSSYSLAKLEEAEALLRDASKEETKKKKRP